MTLKEKQQKIRDRVTEQALGDTSVEVTLSGKSYKLEFSNFAIKGFHKAHGINLITTPVQMYDLEPEAITDLLMFGMFMHQPDITAEEIDRALSTRVLPYVFSRVIESLRYAMPDTSDLPELPEELAAREAAKAADPTK